MSRTIPRLAIALIALAVPFLVAAAPAGSAASARRASKLLPDLQTMRPVAFVIQWEGAQKLLRFANEVGNANTGPLEVYPRSGDCDGDGDPTNDRFAYQRLFRDSNRNGTFDRATDLPTKPILVGCFEFHLEHNHWHFEDFAKYQLKRMTDGKIVRQADKVSFCIVDTARRFPDVPGSPAQPYYASCDADATTGLSPGWSDIYGSYLDGQELDITSLPDGDYCLISTADPSGLLRESDDLNNVASDLVTITGDSVLDHTTSC
jgi:hypothetical protein